MPPLAYVEQFLLVPCEATRETLSAVKQRNPLVPFFRGRPVAGAVRLPIDLRRRRCPQVVFGLAPMRVHSSGAD